ncbi:MAG: glycosyltransferase family 2 protein [Desulfovibrio sp.]|jgi:GT2 family glycosyltransferase
MRIRETAAAVVLVHFGRVETTARCLRALTRTAGSARIIVSNNGSPDQGEALASLVGEDGRETLILNELPTSAGATSERHGKSPVFILQNKSNLGFAAGCNQGIRLAWTLGGVDCVWLLNNDTQPAPGALDALLRDLSAQPDAVLGSTVVHMEQTKDAPGAHTSIQVAGGVRYSAWSTRIRPNHQGELLGNRDVLSDQPMDYVYGASLCCSMDCFRRIGLLDEDFFLFYEELDFCCRARQAGFTLAWCRDSIVSHQGSAAVGDSASGTVRQRRVAAFHEARSTIIFTRKRHPWLLTFALAARVLVKPVFLLIRGDGKSLRPSLCGVWRGLTARLGKGTP